MPYNNVLPRLSHRSSVKEKVLNLNVLRDAAVLFGVVLIGYGVYTAFYGTVNNNKNNVPKVTLQLEDGSLKEINEATIQVISTKEGEVTLSQNGNKLLYADVDQKIDTVIHYNTLTVPYGKMFDVVLSDVTLVMLNSGSKLRYPVNFVEGGERGVYLAGEAYFEVTENKEHPFIVHSDKMNIRVLGTKFNVSAYPDDDQTTAVLAFGNIAA